MALQRNKTLKKLLKSRAAVEFKNMMRKALEKQWEQYVYSLQTDSLYSRYSNVVAKPPKKKTKKHTCNHKHHNVYKAEVEPEYGFPDVPEDVEKPALPISAFEAAVTSAFAGIVYSIHDQGIDEDIDRYITYTANKGGQEIIDNIPGIQGNIKFRLSKESYKKNIKSRVDGLITNLDRTTKRRYKQALVRALGKDMAKQELYDSLLKYGKGLSKSRAAMIARTETLAAYEYMKFETAKVNGIRYKTWQNLGARPCPLCQELDGIEKKMNEKFDSGDYSVYFPPLHPSCECEVTYFDDKAFSECLCSNYVSKKYDYNLSGEQGVCCNPNAVWAGGESLVGPDKNVGNYYNRMRRAKTAETKSLIMSEASAELSDLGVAQLNLKLDKVINN